MIFADIKWNILLLFSAICAAFSFTSGLPTLYFRPSHASWYQHTN